MQEKDVRKVFFFLSFRRGRVLKLSFHCSSVKGGKTRSGSLGADSVSVRDATIDNIGRITVYHHMIHSPIQCIRIRKFKLMLRL